MAKKLSKPLPITIIVIMIVLSPALLFFYWMSPPRQGLREAERDFLRNKDLIVFVRDY